jgi:deoxycytidine triphosphate deaminase
LLERLRATIGTGHVEEATDGLSSLVVRKAADIQYILSQVLPYLTRRRDTASRALAELKSSKSIVVDPKRFDAESFIDFEGDVCVIPPNSFALSRTVEYFRVPRTVLTICVGKSSYARCGIIVNVTPFEPEWEGYVTLEISNTTPLPAKIYANEGIAQVLFFQGDEECETSYADKKGKYQRQQSIVLPRL